MSATIQEQPTAVRGLAAAHVAASNAASEAFFEAHADAVGRACHAMATRFQAGGRWLVHGEGAQRSDVAHIVVEFLHPVIVGKRALPAMALRTAAELPTLGRAGDILMLLRAGSLAADDVGSLAVATARGMLAIALTGAEPRAAPATSASFHFAVPSDDPLVVQEVHEMLYHVLWELTHVFFEHRAVTA